MQLDSNLFRDVFDEAVAFVPTGDLAWGDFTSNDLPESFKDASDVVLA